MYGPKIPNAFDTINPSDTPVCRKQVGYVSIDCK